MESLKIASKSDSGPRRPLDEAQIQRSARDLSHCVANDQFVRAKLILKNLSTIDRIAVVSTRSTDGNGPLFLASQLGYVQFVNLLIEEGHADIEQLGTYEVSEDRSKHKVSPLWCAAVTNRLEVVRTLVRHGANVNAPSDTESTPVRSACYMTNIDVVKFLVDEAGADIHKPNMNGGTCLINSVQSAELCQFLIDRGADVNAHDNSGNLALHYAIREGRLETVKLLLKSGSNVYAKNDFGDDAIHSAALRGYCEILEYLLEEVKPSTKCQIEAWELLGTNYVDEKHDIPGALRYWEKALNMRCEIAMKDTESLKQNEDMEQNAEGVMKDESMRQDEDIKSVEKLENVKKSPVFGYICKETREVGPPGELPPNPAYRLAREPRNVTSLKQLGTNSDRVYMHALMLRERILGSGHKDTMFGLMYRGAVYADTHDYQRCVDLWKYAFVLRNTRNQLLTQEYIFTLQALCKLFWEVLDEAGARFVSSQQILLDRMSSTAAGRESLSIKFSDAYEVMEMTVDGIANGKDMFMSPQDGSRRQDELLVALQLSLHLIQLMIRMNVISKVTHDDFNRFKALVHRLVRIDIRLADGRSLLHLSVDRRTSTVSDEFFSQFPSAEVVAVLLECGAKADDIDSRGNTPLHTVARDLVQFSVRAGSVGPEKDELISTACDLIRRGAHIDRVNAEGERAAEGLSQHVMSFDWVSLTSLKCLAARAIKKKNITYRGLVPKALYDFIDMH